MNTELRKNITWVGYIDWTVRDFHGYTAERGTTYNAYLIQDDKTALVDTVKAPFGHRLLQNISNLTSLNSIDYVVCNHAEPDHAGALPEIMAALPNATLVLDQKCMDALSEHGDMSGWRTKIVKTGDTVTLGNRTLRFIETPMVHWPESMFTLVPEEKLLFSMDAFGQHYASTQRFADEISLGTVMNETRAYYANILMPYGKQIAKVLKQMDTIDIEMIAPSHGLIWRTHIAELLEAYGNWAAHQPKRKILVIYDTMWESTGEMARAILEGASLNDVDAQLIHVRSSNLTHIATESLEAAAIAFGSSTLNNGMMPMAAAVMTYLKGLRPQGKAGFSFGSFGWGRGGPEAVHDFMESMKWEMLREPLKSKYRPSSEILDECRNAGRMLAEKAKEMA
ncbi:MAG: FprA family A-type flavoprotein [Candidatus Zixiibacteriota bacterium]|nr:MAG: FprA family A-type flavoprotein [candidate division Zixibacteria bacterium]